MMTLGLAAMFIDLTIAGVVQGYLWQNLAPWERTLIASAPFWHVRTMAGTDIVAAAMLQAYNMWMTAKSRSSASAGRRRVPAPAAAVRRNPWRSSLRFGWAEACSASRSPGRSRGISPIAHLSKIPYKNSTRSRPSRAKSSSQLAQKYPAVQEVLWRGQRADLPRGAPPRAGHLHRRGLLALSLAVRAPRLQRGRPLRQGVLCSRVHERDVPPAPLRHAEGRAGSHPRGRRHGNDWHVAHFFDATAVVPTSVMPRYTWFYDGARAQQAGNRDHHLRAVARAAGRRPRWSRERRRWPMQAK
jgi:hypothetical protein